MSCYTFLNDLFCDVFNESHNGGHTIEGVFCGINLSLGCDNKVISLQL